MHATTATSRFHLAHTHGTATASPARTSSPALEIAMAGATGWTGTRTRTAVMAIAVAYALACCCTLIGVASAAPVSHTKTDCRLQSTRTGRGARRRATGRTHADTSGIVPPTPETHPRCSVTAVILAQRARRTALTQRCRLAQDSRSILLRSGASSR